EPSFSIKTGTVEGLDHATTNQLQPRLNGLKKDVLNITFALFSCGVKPLGGLRLALKGGIKLISECGYLFYYVASINSDEIERET
ncbi:hypothetical protein DRO29_01100, partial [Candidatus Bathyarchaeota archaeon]